MSTIIENLHTPYPICMQKEDYEAFYPYAKIGTFPSSSVVWDRVNHLYTATATVEMWNRAKFVLTFLSAHQNMETVMRVDICYHTGMDNICYVGSIDKTAYPSEWNRALSLVQGRVMKGLQDYVLMHKEVGMDK